MANVPIERPVDPADLSVIRAGGASGVLIAIGYVVIIAVYAVVGAPPDDGAAWLAYGAGKSGPWWIIVALSVVTDLLFVPLVIALTLVMGAAVRLTMAVATAFVVLFVVLDLAVTWTNIAALIQLSEVHASATTDAERNAAVAAASYAAAVLATTLAAVYNIVTLSVGILLAGMAALRARFGRETAWLGIATGVFGILAVAGPLVVAGAGAVVILASLLTTLWALAAGIRLLRLGRSAAPARA